MTTLRELRPEHLSATLRDVIDSHALRRATQQARRFLADTGIGLAFSAAAGAIGGWHAAGSGLTATACVLALRLWVDRVRSGHHAILDAPGGRQVTFGALAKLEVGALGIDRGFAWAVYETPDSDPRIMSNDDFEAFRLEVPSVVEVRVGRGLITVARFTAGKVDSSASGLPGHEFYKPDGTRVETTWFVMGRETTMDEALQANLQLRELCDAVEEAVAAP